jgi:hypothetical protein
VQGEYLIVLPRTRAQKKMVVRHFIDFAHSP